MEPEKFTVTQQEALDKILALLAIEEESGTITKRARSRIMQALSDYDLAAIAPEIVRFKRSLPAKARPTGGAK